MLLSGVKPPIVGGQRTPHIWRQGGSFGVPTIRGGRSFAGLPSADPPSTGLVGWLIGFPAESNFDFSSFLGPIERPFSAWVISKGENEKSLAEPERRFAELPVGEVGELPRGELALQIGAFALLSPRGFRSSGAVGGAGIR